MSEYHINASSLPPPPGTVIQLTPDEGASVLPVAGNINLFTQDSVLDRDNGIRSFNGGAGELDIRLTNRQTGTVTTTNTTITTILTFSMGATPGTFYVYGNVQAFNASTPASAAYSFSGGYRTDGAVSTELGTEFHDTFQDAALMTSDIFLTSSGNNILVQVQGVGVLSINWNCLLEFRQVT